MPHLTKVCLLLFLSCVNAIARSTSNTTHTMISVNIELDSSTVPNDGLIIRSFDPLSNSSHCPTERAIKFIL
jgi:hypothetical protein